MTEKTVVFRLRVPALVDDEVQKLTKKKSKQINITVTKNKVYNSLIVTGLAIETQKDR